MRADSRSSVPVDGGRNWSWESEWLVWYPPLVGPSSAAWVVHAHTAMCLGSRHNTHSHVQYPVPDWKGFSSLEIRSIPMKSFILEITETVFNKCSGGVEGGPMSGLGWNVQRTLPVEDGAQIGLERWIAFGQWEEREQRILGNKISAYL